MLTIRPIDRPVSSGCILHIHGGGHVAGSAAGCGVRGGFGTDSGYLNNASFARAFPRSLGVTPSDDRAMPTAA